MSFFQKLFDQPLMKSTGLFGSSLLERKQFFPVWNPVIIDEQFLIFTSVDRTDSYGSADLYYSLRNSDGTWMPARNMGTKFNTDSYEYCTYLTTDKQYLFYSTNYDVKWISTRYFPWKMRSNEGR